MQKRKKRKTKLGGFNMPRKSVNKFTDENLIDAIYRANKELIDQKMDELGVKGNKKGAFRELIHGYMDDGLTVQKSIKHAWNSTIFTPVGTRAQNNLRKSITKDEMKQIREDIGYSEKISADKFDYEGVVTKEDGTTWHVYRVKSSDGKRVSRIYRATYDKRRYKKEKKHAQ